MSIKRYLVLVLSAVIVLLTYSAALQGYRSSLQQAELLADHSLQQFALSLSAHYQNQPHSKAQQPEQITNKTDIRIQVWYKNRLISRSANTPSFALSHHQTGFSFSNFNHQRWRIYGYVKNNWLVITAQPAANIYASAESLIITAITPLIIAIPVIALLIWWLVKRALIPLQQLSDLLHAKQINDLAPIKLDYLPNELQTVQATLNQLFERLTHAFTQEKRLASDAAHELRTPLAALKLDAENLAQQYPDNVLVNQLVNSANRMAHVIDQILALNRNTPELFRQQLSQLNITQVAQDVIQQLYSAIAKKQQTIALEADTIEITSNYFALFTLLQNLISNANKYAFEHGNILLRITRTSTDKLAIIVEDSGPGISKEQAELALQPFHRLGGDQHQSKQIGSGLGLAIVKHIVELHGGEIQFDRSTQLSGLKLTVLLPISPCLKETD